MVIAAQKRVAALAIVSPFAFEVSVSITPVVCNYVRCRSHGQSMSVVMSPSRLKALLVGGSAPRMKDRAPAQLSPLQPVLFAPFGQL